MTHARFDDDLAVSTIRGHWQIPALTWVTRILLAAAVIGVLAPSNIGTSIQIAVVATAIAVPLVRVAWLIHRWRQEQDWRFVWLGLALLAVIAGGAFATLW